MNKKTLRVIKSILIIIVCFLVIATVYYAIYPALLCDAIANNRDTKEYLLRHPIGEVNRQTYPDFINPITIALFEDHAQKPLIVACRHGDIEAIEVLLNQGADPNEVCGFSAIEAVYASPNKTNRLEIAQLLVKHCADVTLHVGDRSAVFLEMNYSNDEIISWNNISFLLENGCSAVDFYGNTLLHYAVGNGSLYIAEKIISNRIVDIDTQNQNGDTAIIYAVKKGDIDMVSFLIDQGCNILLSNNDNKTAYDYALESGYDQIAELLKP